MNRWVSESKHNEKTTPMGVEKNKITVIHHYSLSRMYRLDDCLLALATDKSGSRASLAGTFTKTIEGHRWFGQGGNSENGIIRASR